MSRINSSPDISRKTLLSAVAFLVIFAVAIVIILSLNKHYQTKNQEIKNRIAQAQADLLELGFQSKTADLQGSTNTEPQDVSDYPVYNWQGDVTKVEDNKIIFRSPYENSLTKGDDYMDVIVNIKPETEFFKLSLSKPLAPNEIIYSRASQIEKSKIQTGQKIIAQSEEDLNLNLEMDATAVYLIET